MEFNLGLVFLKKKLFVMGFGVCIKMEFDLGLGFLKKIFLFWVLGFIHKCTEMGLCVWS